MRDGFVIHHNGPDADCVGRPHDRCSAFWNAVRDYHVDVKGWSDIAYSFGVCPHGTRFVGRGWDRAQFANGEDVVGPDDGPDSAWYSVLVFLGWHEEDGKPVDEEPTPEMVAGVKALIAEGRSSGRCGTRVLPHNAFKLKRCPGAAFTLLAAAWNDKPLTTSGDDLSMADAADILAKLAELETQLARVTTANILDAKPSDERSVVERRVSATYRETAGLKAQLAALTDVLGQLGAGGSIDYAKVEAAAEKAVRDVLGGLDG